MCFMSLESTFMKFFLVGYEAFFIVKSAFIGPRAETYRPVVYKITFLPCIQKHYSYLVVKVVFLH